MRIAMFTETWLPARDGVVTSLVAARKGLEALGHEVHIFAAGSAEAAAANTDPQVHIFAGRPWRKYPQYHLVYGRTPARDLVREHRIEVIHAHGPATMALRAVKIAKRERLPLVFTYHTRVDEATAYVAQSAWMQARLRALFRRWYARYFRRSDAVIAPTEWIRDDLIETFGTPLEKLRVVPTGVDAHEFEGGDGAAARAKYGLGAGKVVLTLGRVAPEKNLETLLAAAEIVLRERGDVTFAVAGDGPALDPLKAEADRRALTERVRFLGLVPDEDKRSLYAAADAFASPSTFETQGLAMLEAMAAGLPVAVADTGGPTHFVEADENGFMFPGRDPAACAAAIVKALGAGPDLRARARETARRYSIEVQAKALAAVYDEVTRTRAAGKPLTSP